MVKVENEAPARQRKPPEIANRSTLDKGASPRLYSKWVKSSSRPDPSRLCCTAPPKAVKSVKLIASSRAVSVPKGMLLFRCRDVIGAVALDR